MTLSDRIVIGAQYYRPPNPPRQDWERDLRLMAETGFNTVKLWACWSWMNPREGHYDFEDLDRLMALSEAAGLKVVLNVILEDAPYWLEGAHPEARYRDAENRAIRLGAAMNTPGGGWPGLCFDNPAVMEAGLAFLGAMVARYAGHAALLAWDVWNEPHLEPASYFPDRLYCYCEASVRRFRSWLEQRNGSIDALNARWARRYSCWSEVEPPRLFEAVPDMLDWREFWFDTLRGWLDARVATAKAAGSREPVMTHVALSGFTGQLATHTLDEWTLAGAVDGFGTSSFPTWLMADDPVEHLMNLDTARAAAGPTPFWQTELQGGRGRRDGLRSTRHPRPEIVTLEMWNALAAGARGILFWQWRPELLGPESPGYGLSAVDGSPTPRTEAAGRFAAMVAASDEFRTMRPVAPRTAILVSRRTALHAFATDRTMDIYRKAVMGAYRLMIDADIPVDFLHEDVIERDGVPRGIERIYAPMPAAVSGRLAKRLADWIADGGHLISEAGLGSYDERGWHRPSYPPAALAAAFGLSCVEADAVSAPVPLAIDGHTLDGGWLSERLAPAGATVCGQFGDGEAGATRHAFGKGEAMLIATCPSVAYEASRSAATRLAIARLLAPDGTSARLVEPVEPKPGLMVRSQRLADGRDGAIVLNWTENPQMFRASRSITLRGIGGSALAVEGEAISLQPLSAFLAIG